jgi:hypothetical protein
VSTHRTRVFTDRSKAVAVEAVAMVGGSCHVAGIVREGQEVVV